MPKFRLTSHLLLIVIFLGWALRVCTAFFSIGFDHPNEIYRLLEPIAKLQGFSVWLPFEWTDQLLSSLNVKFHSHLLSFLNHEFPTLEKNGMAQMFLLRILYATLGMLPVLATWKWLSRHTSSGWTFVGVALISLWPELIYRSVRLMDYSLEAAGLALAFLLVFNSFKNQKLSLSCHALAGFVLAALFFVRNQTGLHWVSFSVILLFLNSDSLKTKFSRFVLFTAIYGIGVFFLASSEAHFQSSSFLLPFKNYIQFNFFEHRAAMDFGSAPWHRYFSDATKYFGGALFPLLLLLHFRKTVDLRIGLLWAFPFLIHTLLAHKEARFLYGILWVLIPSAFSGLPSLQTLHRRLVLPLKFFLVVSLGVSFWMNLRHVQIQFFMHADDVQAFHYFNPKIQPNPSQIQYAGNGLLLFGNPDYVPGSFFLRYGGPFCYEHPGKKNCPPHFDPRYLLMKSSYSDSLKPLQWNGKLYVPIDKNNHWFLFESTVLEKVL